VGAGRDQGGGASCPAGLANQGRGGRMVRFASLSYMAGRSPSVREVINKGITMRGGGY